MTTPYSTETTLSYPNKQNERLVGTLRNGQPGPLVVLVHGFCGNKDENGLFSEFAAYLADRQCNSFRFNMSGIGGSEGDFQNSSIDKQASDLDATVDFLSTRFPQSRLGVVGFSLGAAVALRSNNPKVCSYSLWSPAFFPAKDMYPRYKTPEILESLAAKGYFEKSGLKVGQTMFADLGSFSAEGTLRKIHLPIQIIHGTNDSRISYASSTLAERMLTNGHEMVKVDGADHSYKNSEHRQYVFQRAASWFTRTL